MEVSRQGGVAYNLWVFNLRSRRLAPQRSPKLKKQLNLQGFRPFNLNPTCLSCVWFGPLRQRVSGCQIAGGIKWDLGKFRFGFRGLGLRAFRVEGLGFRLQA